MEKLFIKCTTSEFKDFENIIFKQEYDETLSEFVVKYIEVSIISGNLSGEVYKYKLSKNNNIYIYITD